MSQNQEILALCSRSLSFASSLFLRFLSYSQEPLALKYAFGYVLKALYCHTVHLGLVFPSGEVIVWTCCRLGHTFYKVIHSSKGLFTHPSSLPALFLFTINSAFFFFFLRSFAVKEEMQCGLECPGPHRVALEQLLDSEEGPSASFSWVCSLLPAGAPQASSFFTSPTQNTSSGRPGSLLSSQSSMQI